jgi:hypothetical protein
MSLLYIIIIIIITITITIHAVKINIAVSYNLIFLACITFLGAFALLRKATISFVMFVCLSARNNSAPTGRIFIIFEYFSKIYRENSSFKKPDKNNDYLTWRPIYIYDHISLSSS